MELRGLTFMSLVMLRKNGQTGRMICPDCSKDLDYEEGGAVRIVSGRLDMENIKAKHICKGCGKFYREVMNTGYYDVFPIDDGREVVKEKPAAAVKKIKSVGDLPPMQLKKDSDGHCTCPRCGGVMDYVEGQPVHLVDGRADMEDVLPHFYCSECSSIFRRIASTDYYQFSEK